MSTNAPTADHLHYITHNHEAGFGIDTKFTCTGDRTSPCHQYPPTELGMEQWSDEDKHLFVPHDACWLEVWMTKADCASLCGPDCEPVRSGPITVTWNGVCVEWEYAEVERLRALTTVDDDMVVRVARALHAAGEAPGELSWDDEPEMSRRGYRRLVRAMLDAALNPGEEA